MRIANTLKRWFYRAGWLMEDAPMSATMSQDDVDSLVMDLARVMRQHGVAANSNEHLNFIRSWVCHEVAEWFDLNIPAERAYPHTKYFENKKDRYG